MSIIERARQIDLTPDISTSHNLYLSLKQAVHIFHLSFFFIENKFI